MDTSYSALALAARKKVDPTRDFVRDRKNGAHYRRLHGHRRKAVLSRQFESPLTRTREATILFGEESPLVVRWSEPGTVWRSAGTFRMPARRGSLVSLRVVNVHPTQRSYA